MQRYDITNVRIFVCRMPFREFVPRCQVLFAYYSWIVESGILTLKLDLDHRTLMCACQNGDMFLR